MAKKVHALVPAAGTGRRVGGPVSKQYLTLAGRPILAHTLSRLASLEQVARIFLIVPESEIDYCRNAVVEQFAIQKIAGIVAGGRERQDSVRNGLLACNADEKDLVLVHDGVRPFFPKHQARALLEAAQRTGAALLAIPAQDSIKQVLNGKVQQTMDRQLLWQAQTPQAFRFERIMKAHQRAWDEGFYGTDDSSLVEWCNWPVEVVVGSSHNLKITTPADLALARALVAAGELDLS